jgi:3-oxocholest-4-en-26-oate---CoA ligase
MEWTLTAVQDVIAAAAPSRTMLVHGETRRSYDEVRVRSTGLAHFLAAHGLGAHRERAGLERWACGQSTVGLVLHNRCEYIESMLGCYRARSAPFNVNYNYRPAELRALFDMVAAEALVYERALGPVLAEAIQGLDLVLIDVDDRSGVPPLPGSTGFEEAVATSSDDALSVPSPDDLYLICTGGTTGLPKAVLWRQADIFVSAMSGSDETTAESLRQIVAADLSGAWFPAPPLMHAAAQWTAFAGLHTGGKVVFHDDTNRFDARLILDVCERENVTMMSIVGDAYARPIIEELRRHPRKLPALKRLGTGGAITSDSCKTELLELLPGLTIVDGYGASETGGMAFGAKTRQSTNQGFTPSLGAVVLSEDRRRLLEPGKDEVGWTARRGRVPLGYLGDPERTQATFPVIDGQRFAVPGDRAMVGPDGAIRMLGRDAMVINTGGEKVFVEEVENALKAHPAVYDAIVVGVDDERWGQRGIGLVAITPGAPDPGEAALRDHCRGHIAGYKVPKEIYTVGEVFRGPNGKADYKLSKQRATQLSAQRSG